MNRSTLTFYTLVQHSAWVVNQDPQFEKAVEEAIITIPIANKVHKAHGLILLDYMLADNAGEDINYPSAVTGLIPKVQGTFANMKVEGAKVYSPTVAEYKKWDQWFESHKRN